MSRNKVDTNELIKSNPDYAGHPGEMPPSYDDVVAEDAIIAKAAENSDDSKQQPFFIIRFFTWIFNIIRSFFNYFISSGAQDEYRQREDNNSERSEESKARVATD